MTIIKPTDAAKVPMSFKIAQYVKNNPTAKAADVAVAVGSTTPYVYVVMSKLKGKAKKTKPTPAQRAEAIRLKMAKIEGEKKMMPRMQGGVTAQMMKDTVTFMQNEKADNVNHPAHYKVGGIETIDFIEAKGLTYNLGNVVKYITRADHKGNTQEDLLKARWYLNREIAKFAK